MPVIGTPSPAAPEQCAPCNTVAVPPASLATVSCDVQGIISTETSTVNRQPLLTRTRAVRVTGGSAPTLNWTMHDENGNPVDLTVCLCPEDAATSSSSSASVSSNSSNSSDSSGSSDSASSTSVSSADAADIAACPCSVKLRLREQLSIGRDSITKPAVFAATIVNAEAGQVSVALPLNSTTVPGVYFAEMALVCLDADGCEYIVFSNVFYAIIERGLWSAGARGNCALGPPSLAEVRLQLRDSSPAESFLLDNLMFDDAEIALSIQRPVQYWNEIPPPLNPLLTTQNFPYRYHWLEGIAGNLFLIAAESYRRNNLTYSAGGVQLNDQDKEPNYQREGERRWNDFRAFVRAKKASINLEAGFGEVGSTY